MPTVTTSELVDRAKAVSDMRDNFVTPTQWMYWASQERLALDLFISRSGWPLNITSFDISVLGNEGGVFPLNPTGGVLAIVCIHEVEGDRVRRLKLNDAITFFRQPTGTSGGLQGHASTYRAIWSGDNINLEMYPSPSAGETYRVTYIPHPLRLTLDASPATGYGNSVSYPLGWEERIVLGMARRALMKEESDTRTVDQEIALWDQRIEEACWNRILGASPSMRNVDDERGWSANTSIPPPGSWWFA